MKTPKERQVKRNPRMRFYRWVWLLAILLVACAPGAPSALPASGGEAGVDATDTPASTEEATAEATSTPESVEETPTVVASSSPGVAILVVDFFGTPSEESGDNNN